MTQFSDDSLPEPPRLTWRCPICKKLLVLRPTTEDEEQFRSRCSAHENAAKVCHAKMLALKLKAAGLVPLVTNDFGSFVLGYIAVKDAGLVTRHFTQVKDDDYVSSAPWGPAWATEYEEHMRKRRLPLAERVAALTEAAVSPESIDRVKAFLALAETVDSTDDA